VEFADSVSKTSKHLVAARQAEKSFGSLPVDLLLKLAREAHDKVLKEGNVLDRFGKAGGGGSSNSSMGGSDHHEHEQDNDDDDDDDDKRSLTGGNKRGHQIIAGGSSNSSSSSKALRAESGIPGGGSVTQQMFNAGLTEGNQEED